MVCLLPSAVCLSAFCLLPPAVCLPPSASCLLPSASCRLPSAVCRPPPRPVLTLAFLLFTFYFFPSPLYHSRRAHSHSQTGQHRRHRAHTPVPGSPAAGLSKRRNLLGGRTSISRNFKRQPHSGSPHRSRHEGAEARTDVWGDAAGTAPAVTSVTCLGLRPRIRLSGLN